MKKQNSNGNRKIIVSIAIALAVIFAGFAGMGIYANSLETIFPNVSMEGTDLSSMTSSEAADALIANNVGTDDDRILTVSLPAGCELSISGKDAGSYLSAPDAAVYAYDACHGGSFFANTLNYIKCALSGMKLVASNGENLNEDYLHARIDEGIKESSLKLMQSSVDIGEDTITVVKGASSVQIDSDELYNMIKEALINGIYDPIKYTAQTVEGSKTDTINLQELYDTVFEEPVNAEYDPETRQATEHVTGRSFDIDVAQNLWDEAKNGDEVVIPLIKKEPEITTEKLNSMLFADLLSQKSTSLQGSSSNRISNVTKAAAAINGIVLNPGEEFSYNKTLGQRTKAAGYLEAGAYSGGQVVQEVGGGICQVSSTLYYCSLVANLEITDRTCHYFGVSYLPAGLDATVSWPSPDFKFKNNSAYPIKILASVDKAKNTVSVQIYGSNPDGIRVEMTTSSWQLADGYGAQSTRNVYDKDGNLISSKPESKSRYYYHPSPSPSPSPSASPSISPSPSATPTPTPTQPVTPSPSATVNPVSGTDIIG
ncbi:MAG: VanW family protein [Oscillospiraceae bacterium]|nr:VanW family protein [Oscillospiraceae bacterium]